MKCDIKDVNQCTKVLSVEVPSVMINESYDQYYNEISHSAKVPGFRQGKAPKNVLMMHYKKQAEEEVMKRLVSVSFQRAIEEKNIRPMGYPSFDEIDFSKEILRYKATVEVKPKVVPKKYKGLRGQREKINVDTKEVDEVINRIRDGYAKFVPIEDRGIELGDYAVCDIESTIEGETTEKKENEWVEIQENDMIKGFALQVLGLRSGDEKDIEVTLSDKLPNEKIRGKKALFKVRVKEIKKKELPELDKEFLKNVGDYPSSEDFREAIKKDIEARKKADTESKLERELLDKIDKDTKFDVPKSIVERRLESMVQEAINSMVQRGMPKEEAFQKESEFRKNFEQEAIRQVRVAFILDAIAELENIEVNEEDINNRLKQFATQVRQPVEMIREYYEKNNMMDQLYSEIRNQKVVDFIKQNADIK